MEEGMAKRIKDLRTEKKLTLEQVADVVGVGKSTVRKWETGIIANMKRDKILSLAKALGTTPEYLMGWDDKKENPDQLVLTGVDKELYEILKLIPEDQKKIFLEMGRVFVNNLNKG